MSNIQDYNINLKSFKCFYCNKRTKSPKNRVLSFSNMGLKGAQLSSFYFYACKEHKNLLFKAEKLHGEFLNNFNMSLKLFNNRSTKILNVYSEVCTLDF